VRRLINFRNTAVTIYIYIYITQFSNMKFYILITHILSVILVAQNKQRLCPLTVLTGLCNNNNAVFSVRWENYLNIIGTNWRLYWTKLIAVILKHLYGMFLWEISSQNLCVLYLYVMQLHLRIFQNFDLFGKMLKFWTFMNFQAHDLHRIELNKYWCALWKLL
jgi:hypothetical protein